MKKATTSRVEGKVQEIAGAVKARVGGAIGDERMQASGEANRAQGQARQEAAKASERVHGTVQQVAGAVKEGVGDLIGDNTMELEGKAKKLEGKARKKANS